MKGGPREYRDHQEFRPDAAMRRRPRQGLGWVVGAADGRWTRQPGLLGGGGGRGCRLQQEEGSWHFQAWGRGGREKAAPGEGWREGGRVEGPRSGGEQRLSDGAEGVGGSWSLAPGEGVRAGGRRAGSGDPSSVPCLSRSLSLASRTRRLRLSGGGDPTMSEPTAPLPRALLLGHREETTCVPAGQPLGRARLRLSALE